MEWVETTGRTVAEAIDAALDELGVDEEDAEVVVVSEPRAGLFGIGRGEARVRARVRPATVRPKRPQRERARAARAARSGSNRTAAALRQETLARESDGNANGTEDAQEPGSIAAKKTRARRRRAGRGRKSPSGRPRGAGPTDKESEMSVEEQVELASGFVRGVVERFGFDASTSSRVDEEHIFVDVEGDDLGLLIGPRGSTLDALQELARTVVHRQGEDQVLRVVVDVAGFRKRRAEALAAFARRRAEEVLSSGVSEALEPMGAADRKIVHDTVAELEGLETTSEGFEPKRFVVIRPAGGPGAIDSGDDGAE